MISPIYSPIVSPVSPLIVTPNNVIYNNNIVSPIVPVVRPVVQVPIYRPLINVPYIRPYFYTSSGIDENPIAVNDVVVEARHKYLDKWLYEFSETLQLLKIENGRVVVISYEESKTNDISKDSRRDLEQKSDYIGDEILTLSKCKKILSLFCHKNNFKFYDIPHESRYVKKALNKYIVGKLRESHKK